MIKLKLPLGIASALTAFSVFAASPFAPTNDVTDPVGTDAAPWFGWHVNDPDTNEIQTAYQILVASSEANLASDIGDLWDSGKTTSRTQNHVAYEGRKRYGDQHQ